MRCSRPNITELENKYVQDVLATGDIGVGDYIDKFEKAWASWNLYEYGVSCNSGTNALFLALRALGIGVGNEVIVPEFTMVATAWAVSYTGARPVFVDCGNDLNIDVSKIKEKITKDTRAIIAVHIYGRQCDMDAINKLADEYGLYVIEDMAEAHGIRPLGDIACYSFYGNKILTTGEGGMCLTDNEEWRDEMRSLANMYFDKDRTLVHPKLGYNFRMTNIQAAIGLAQVERAYDILEKRRLIEEWYDKYLPKRMVRPKRDVLWMYDIDCHNKQEKVKKALKQANIESRYFFKPMSQQPMYLSEYERLNAFKWACRGLYLPTYTDMSESDVLLVCKVINSLEI